MCYLTVVELQTSISSEMPFTGSSVSNLQNFPKIQERTINEYRKEGQNFEMFRDDNMGLLFALLQYEASSSKQSKPSMSVSSGILSRKYWIQYVFADRRMVPRIHPQDDITCIGGTELQLRRSTRTAGHENCVSSSIRVQDAPAFALEAPRFRHM